MRPIVRRLAIVVAVALGLGAAPALAQDQAARASVGKPVQEAQALLRQHKTKEALAKLAAADRVPDKTKYEKYVIEETRANADIAAGDDPGAIAALEAVLATGILSKTESLQRTLTLVQLAYRTKDYAKTVAFAERYYQDGGGDAAPRLLEAQAYYLQNDFANAEKSLRGVAEADDRAGRKPTEDMLLMLAGSAFKQNDQAGYVGALERLVTLYPKQDYWVQLTGAVGRDPRFAGRLRLDLDRLMVAVGAMTAPEQYVTAAERALEAGFPGDAKAFLAKGTAAGILGTGPQAERQKRLADMAGGQAMSDLAALAQRQREADAAATGMPLEQLGEAYASYGKYDDATAALAKAIAKGGLKFPDDAKLHLGIADLRASRPADAKPLLAGITGDDGTRMLAQLWTIEGGR
jgi:tetratricopeptide (TPR) repeat protein